MSQGDSVLEVIESLYPSERVGRPFTQKRLSRERKMGAERFAALVPPGYADLKNKSGDRVYGDYFLWAQLIAHARKTKNDVIWVTNDQKDDWVDPKTEKFYPELTDEFVARTGQLIVLYKSGEFVEEAKRRLVSMQETDEEIEEVARELDRQGKFDLASYLLRDAGIASLSDIAENSYSKLNLSNILGKDFNERVGLTNLVNGLTADRLGYVPTSLISMLANESTATAGLGSLALSAGRIVNQLDKPPGALAQVALRLALEERERREALQRDAAGVQWQAPEINESESQEDDDRD